MLGRWVCKVALGIWVIGSNGLPGCHQPKAWALTISSPVFYSSQDSASQEREVDWPDLAINFSKITKNAPQAVHQRKSTITKRWWRDWAGKITRHLPEWARATADGLTASSIFLDRDIHSLIYSISPPTMSTYYGVDNVLHAGNTVFNNSVVQRIHGI